MIQLIKDILDTSLVEPIVRLIIEGLPRGSSLLTESGGIIKTIDGDDTQYYNSISIIASNRKEGVKNF